MNELLDIGVLDRATRRQREAIDPLVEDKASGMGGDFVAHSLEAPYPINIPHAERTDSTQFREERCRYIIDVSIDDVVSVATTRVEVHDLLDGDASGGSEVALRRGRCRWPHADRDDFRGAPACSLQQPREELHRVRIATRSIWHLRRDRKSVV